ncbi:MAG: hypothetical protein LBD48_07170 [Treponema sp.]|jgi:hypothetical protein|nr:hypothetical protein [Treponema sp.]
MKHFQRVLLVILLPLLAACQNGLFSPPESTNTGGHSRVVLSVTGAEPASAKTLWPLQQPVFTKYGIEIYSCDSSGGTESLSSSVDKTLDDFVDGKVTLNLNDGYYKIRVKGYINTNDLAAMGEGQTETSPGVWSSVIEVKPNQPTSVRVILRPTMSASENQATGEFAWTIKIPQDTAKVTRAVFRIYRWDEYNTSPGVLPVPPADETDTSPRNTPLYNLIFRSEPGDSTRYGGWLGTQSHAGINDPNHISTAGAVTANSGLVTLNPGTYFVTLILHNNNDTFFGRSEIVHVYSNMKTETYEQDDVKTLGWDFTGGQYYPRVITLGGSISVTVNGGSPAGSTVVYVYTGTGNIGINETGRLAGQFFYENGEPYSVTFTVPDAGETLQFHVRGDFSQTAQYKLGEYTIPPYQSGETGTITWNIPAFNIVFVQVTGRLNAHYIGKDQKEMWWLNIEAYDDAAYTSYLSAAGVPPGKNETGLTAFEMILPAASRPYYFKIQAGSEVSGILPLKNYEKRVTLTLPPSGEIDLGDIYFNGKGFVFNGTLDSDLANIKGWGGLSDASPYIAAYDTLDLSGSVLGKSAGLVSGNTWTLKAGAAYETEAAYQAFEFVKNGITYRSLSGEGRFDPGELEQPAKGSGVPDADWDNNFREIASENFPQKSNVLLTLPQVFDKTNGTIGKAGTGAAWLFKPAATGHYVVDAISVNLASAFSPQARVYGAAGEIGGGGALLSLTQGTAYLIAVGDAAGRTGNYLLDITKVEGAAGLLQVESSWDVEKVLREAFEIVEFGGSWAVRVRADMDIDSVARYFDLAFDASKPAYQKVVDGVTYILYPWYWSIDSFGWDPTADYTVYARSGEIGLSIHDTNEDTGQPMWSPGQIVNIKLTLSKNGIPYGRDWLVHIPR